MWLKLDLNGIMFHLKINNYIKTNYSNWDDVWCTVDLCLESEPWLKYHIQSDILLASEVDDLVNILEGILIGSYTEYTEFSFIEPDFCLCFHPNPDYNSLNDLNEYESRLNDISLEWRIFLWDGGLTNNYISVTFQRTYIKYLLTYLKVITGELSEENNNEIKELVQKNILY